MADGSTFRTPCVNPCCGRTAPRTEADEQDIICRKCWRALPKALRDRYQQLQRRQKHMFTLIERRLARGTISRSTIELIERQFTKRCEDNWAAICAYFRPIDKPVGLEGFLREVGL